MTLTNLETAALKRAEQTSQRSDASHLASLLGAAARELRANEATPARLRQLGARCFLFSRALEGTHQKTIIATSGRFRYELYDPEFKQTVLGPAFLGAYRMVSHGKDVLHGEGLFSLKHYSFEEKQ